MNGSGMRPMGYKVLVLPQEVEQQTKGGLYLPDEAKAKDEFARTQGTLVAMSPMAFSFEDDWPAEAADQKPKIGDRVMFAKYHAEEFKGRDGKKYWLMRDTDIIGVMDDD